jgi:hypothetical protein
MNRQIKIKIKGFRTTDGAGVSLVRVLGQQTMKEFDPILMLDSFDSTNPDEYTAGFPMHPHRGIETISYLYKGKMVHKDSLGNEETISSGELQWMNSGSGILHEEMLPASDRLLGVQLWLNLPAEAKMSKPSYRGIKNADIKEVEFKGGHLRLLAGVYKEYEGHKRKHLPIDYYDIHLEPDSEFSLDTAFDASVMIFTLLGEVFVEGAKIEEKTAVKLTDGDKLTIRTGEKEAQILFISSKRLDENIAWAGPIVMNSEKEIQEAFTELRNNTFIKDKTKY